MNIIKKDLTLGQKILKNELIKNGFSPIFSHVLCLREVTSIEEAKYRYKLVPPNKLKGISELSDKLSNNIIQNKKISIVADYDCDGATSCAIAFLGLKMLGCENLNFIVPNRFRHGYGLSQGVVDDLISDKGLPDCIVTVDNGIAAHDGVDYCNSLGIEVLVTDHHLPVKGKPNPNCSALVNPNQDGDDSGLKNMAGCGVIFYVLMETLQRLVEKEVFTKENKPNLLSLMDLVSLGTIADVVKLDKNNRLLVKYGLGLLHKGQTRFGISHLFNISKKTTQFANSRDYGFSIGPRINAAGRLEDMSTGIKCLISKEEKEAVDLAEQLNEWNIKRKTIEKDMKDIAYEIIEDESQENNVTRVIFNENYHEGVIGIVASRIKEKDNVPTIVFSPTEEHEFVKGSGRSIPEVHLRDAIDAVSKEDPTIFRNFGGHAMAAGLTIYRDKLDKFKELFEKVVIDLIGNKPLNKEVFVDLDLDSKDIALSLALELENEIFGQGFLEPNFRSVLVVKEVKYLDDKETGLPVHTSITFEDGTEKGLKGIHFFNTEEIEIGQSLEVIYKMNVNRFGKFTNVNLMISHKNKV